MEPTVEEAVHRAQAGDRQAFELLITRFERAALAVAYAVLLDADLAGDAAQEGFLRAWQRLGELRESSRFGSWLCEIVRNLAHDARRRGKRERRARAEVSLASLPAGGGPVFNLEQKEAGERLDQALAALDEASRTALVLRYYDGLSSKRIGELLGTSPAAVDMRLTRARQMLRARLTE